MPYYLNVRTLTWTCDVSWISYLSSLDTILISAYISHALSNDLTKHCPVGFLILNAKDVPIYFQTIFVRKWRSFGIHKSESLVLATPLVVLNCRTLRCGQTDSATRYSCSSFSQLVHPCKSGNNCDPHFFPPYSGEIVDEARNTCFFLVSQICCIECVIEHVIKLTGGHGKWAMPNGTENRLLQIAPLNT